MMILQNHHSPKPKTSPKATPKTTNVKKSCSSFKKVNPSNSNNNNKNNGAPISNHDRWYGHALEKVIVDDDDEDAENDSSSSTCSHSASSDPLAPPPSPPPPIGGYSADGDSSSKQLSSSPSEASSKQSSTGGDVCYTASNGEYDLIGNRPIKLRFAVAIHKRDTLSLDDYTEQEFNSCWYSPEEKRKKTRQREKIVSRMEAGKLPKNKSMTYRGLEAWTQDGSDKLEKHIGRCIDAVMDEQDLQWSTNKDNYERIAAVSRLVSYQSTELALERAAVDEFEAMEAHQMVDGDSDMDGDEQSVLTSQSAQEATQRRRAGRRPHPRRRHRNDKPQDVLGDETDDIEVPLVPPGALACEVSKTYSNQLLTEMQDSTKRCGPRPRLSAETSNDMLEVMQNSLGGGSNKGGVDKSKPVLKAPKGTARARSKFAILAAANADEKEIDISRPMAPKTKNDRWASVQQSPTKTTNNNNNRDNNSSLNASLGSVNSFWSSKNSMGGSFENKSKTTSKVGGNSLDESSSTNTTSRMSMSSNSTLVSPKRSPEDDTSSSFGSPLGSPQKPVRTRPTSGVKKEKRRSVSLSSPLPKEKNSTKPRRRTSIGCADIPELDVAPPVSVAKKSPTVKKKKVPKKHRSNLDPPPSPGSTSVGTASPKLRSSKRRSSIGVVEGVPPPPPPPPPDVAPSPKSKSKHKRSTIIDGLEIPSTPNSPKQRKHKQKHKPTRGKSVQLPITSSSSELSSSKKKKGSRSSKSKKPSRFASVSSVSDWSKEAMQGSYNLDASLGHLSLSDITKKKKKTKKTKEDRLHSSLGALDTKKIKKKSPSSSKRRGSLGASSVHSTGSHGSQRELPRWAEHDQDKIGSDKKLLRGGSPSRSPTRSGSKKSVTSKFMKERSTKDPTGSSSTSGAMRRSRSTERKKRSTTPTKKRSVSRDDKKKTKKDKENSSEHKRSRSKSVPKKHPSKTRSRSQNRGGSKKTVGSKDDSARSLSPKKSRDKKSVLDRKRNVMMVGSNIEEEETASQRQQPLPDIPYESPKYKENGKKSVMSKIKGILDSPGAPGFPRRHGVAAASPKGARKKSDATTTTTGTDEDMSSPGKGGGAATAAAEGRQEKKQTRKGTNSLFGFRKVAINHKR